MGTRIVVMKDGYIQQVDTPANLYERPQNMFVAGFIGSPQMNFVDVKVEKVTDEKGGEGVALRFGKNSIKLPEGKAKRLLASEYIGKEVVMGIRPENLHDEAVYLESMSDSVVTARVEVVEMLGSETLLYVLVDDVDFIARVNPRTKAKVGDIIKIAFDANKVHLFDKETEKTIMN